MGLQASASPPPSQIPRPPTPPRESARISIDETPNLFPNTRSTKLPTPDSSAEFTTPVDGSRKKVEWSTFTDYQEHPDISSKRNHPLFSLRPLPSSEERKPPKSILKTRNALTPRDPNDSSTPSPPPAFQSFAIMLESMVQQLAGEDRYSRIDAYTTLSGALKICDNVPDPKALKDKMGLISQFIQRDLFAKTDSGDVDSILVNYALTLLSSLLFEPSVTGSFDHDFSVFTMDFAIHAFETGQSSKETIRQLLFVVANQNFSSKVMNVERVGKLITALHTLEDHVKGRAVVMGRITVCLRLLRQARPAMLANTIWIEDMLHDMVSRFPEIRSLAIRFATEAGLALGKENQTSRALQEIFDTERGNDCFAEFYAGRLKAMLAVKADSDQVPQIWTVIILFLRHKRSQLSSWKHVKIWFLLIQACLNHKDVDVRIQALRAWNQLVFVVLTDEKSSVSMVKKLFTPLEVLLINRPSPETRFRDAVFGCVCNLLYYAFRSDVSQQVDQQVDRYWDLYVVQLMNLPVKLKQGKIKGPTNGSTRVQCLGDDLSQPCFILTGLFDTTPKICPEHRAMEKKYLTPAELPGLNPQWIRRNADRILPVMEPLIKALFDGLSNPNSPISILWITFCEALRTAGAKEIKVSNDTMIAIAHIYGMLYRIWNQQMLPSNSKSLFQGLGFLLSSMTSKLGVLPFTEKLLSLGLPDTFDVITTPSSRPRPQRGETKCPLHHVIGLFFQAPPEMRNNLEYTEMVERMLQPFFDDRQSRRTRLDFIQEINQLLPGPSPLGELGNPQAWELLVKLTHQALETPDEARNSGPNGEFQLGSEYRCVVKILETGLATPSDSTVKAASSLFQAFIALVKKESGDSGVAIAVVEPLARGLLERRIPIAEKLLASFCATLLANVQYPRDRHALDSARRRLWGAAGGPRLLTNDMFAALYELASRCLKLAYKELSLEECKSLLSGVCGMLERCPAPCLFSGLEKLQEGLSCWVQDADHKLTDQELVIMLCERTQNAIKKLPNFSTLTLKNLGNLISCGLECRHKFVANAAVETWNSTFGNQRSLEYPARVVEALSRLRPISELKLPFFPNSLPTDFDSAPPEFYDSQDREPTPEISNPLGLSISIPRGKSPATLKKDASKSVIEVKQSITKKRRFEGTPEPVARKHAKRQSTPKLRHDDSQVQFAPIQSSPVSDAAMDSQLLTERQREVKERQKIDAAAIFQKFASSPTKRKDRAMSKSRSRTESPPITAAKDTPGTPVMNTNVPNIFDGLIGSSPTPRRGEASLPDNDAIEPPSSPPEAVLTTAPFLNLREKSPAISQDYGETSLGDVVIGSGGVLQVAANPEPELPQRAQSQALQDSPQRDNGSKVLEKIPSTPLRGHADRIRSQRSPETESEVFMDALSSPSKFTPNKNGKKNSNMSMRESPEPPSLPLEIPAPVQTSPGSQGMARGLFNAAMSFPTNIRSFISPPKAKALDSTMSSPLDEDSVLRVMKQYDPPQTFSQPTTQRDYDNISDAYSSGGSKKRKRQSLSPEGDMDSSKPSHIERDSQESWKPDSPKEVLSVPYPFRTAKQLPSTIPETPIRPGLLQDVNSNVENTALSTSRRPLTRSVRRALLQSRMSSNATTQQTGRDLGNQELDSSAAVPGLNAETGSPSPSTELPDIDLGNPEPTEEFDHDSTLDLGDDEFASTPRFEATTEARGRSSRAQTEPPVSTGNTWASTEEEMDIMPHHREGSPIEEQADDEDGEEEMEMEMELPRERGSSPSMQLLRDSNESSQRLQKAREASIESRKEYEIETEHSGGAGATDLSSIPVKDLLKAATVGLTGVGLGRQELYDLEVLMLDLRGKLIEAEKKGNGTGN